MSKTKEFFYYDEYEEWRKSFCDILDFLKDVMDNKVDNDRKKRTKN